MSTQEKDCFIKEKQIWELVKDLEIKMPLAEQELGEVKATCMINFGAGQNKNPNLVTGKERGMEMLVKIFTYYHEKVKELSKDTEILDWIDNNDVEIVSQEPTRQVTLWNKGWSKIIKMGEEDNIRDSVKQAIKK